MPLPAKGAKGVQEMGAFDAESIGDSCERGARLSAVSDMTTEVLLDVPASPKRAQVECSSWSSFSCSRATGALAEAM